MDVFIVSAAGRPITRTIAFVDETGAAVTPDTLRWRVLDGNLVQLLGWQTVTPPSAATSTTITVPTAQNMLAPGVSYDLRRIEVELQFSGGGAVPLRDDYVLRATDFMVVPNTSFQSYEEALVTVSLLLHVDDFLTASEVVRKTALLRAYHRLTRLGFYIHDELDRMRVIVRPGDRLIVPEDWKTMTLAQFQALPTDFVAALKRAQVLEANEMTSEDVYAEKRKGGLLAESIGESSIMFRSTAPIKSRVSRRALEELSPWIDRSVIASRV